MATIRKVIEIAAPATHVWDAVRDVGAVHRRLCPGVLVDARLDGDTRVVRFANGMEVREQIVAVDDGLRRFAYAAVGGHTRHHNASIEVQEDGPLECRLVWTTDLLPDEVAATIAGLVELGSAAMKRTLEADAG